MKTNSYSILLQKIQSGDIKIISIIAPARSSSTALERALLESPSIDMQINDPWAIYDETAREEKTYDYILNRIEEAGNPKTILIKNIADYIPPDATWTRWSAIVSHHIFLIRNPLLTMHSLLKMVTKHYEATDCVLPDLTMNDYAIKKGFNNWADLQSHISQTTDFTPFEDFYKTAFPTDQEIHDNPIMKAPVLERLKGIDFKSSGFQNLEERAFAYRITGWEALSQHAESTDAPIHVIDSTIYRAHPDEVMKHLSSALDISYSPQTVNWSSENSQNFNTDYDDEIPYYERVKTASGIEPPTEKPLTLSCFPPYFRHHLTENGGAFDIYRKLLQRITPIDWNDALYQADPVFQFMLYSIFKDTRKTEQLIKDHPEFLDVFQSIKA